MAAAETPVIIFDIGSKRTKAGFSIDDAPIAMFPTLVATPRRTSDSEPVDSRHYCAEEALTKQPTHYPKRPVEYGIVTNWELFEEIVKYTYDKRLGVDPALHPVIMIEPAMNPRMNREKMAQIMFETFEIPQYYSGAQEVFALRSSGRSDTGLVIDIGDSDIRAVPVCEGFYLPYVLRRTELAAGLIHENFVKHVTLPDGSPISLSSQYRELMKATERFAFVSSSYEADEQKPESEFERPFTLSDGTQLSIGRARYLCSEFLFKPHFAGLETSSLAENIISCLLRCDPSYRAQLARNIVISGGYSGLPGLVERLTAEIKLVDATFEHPIQIRAHPQPTYSAWAGAQTLPSSPTFVTESMSKEEYDENGPILVHRKFIA